MGRAYNYDGEEHTATIQNDIVQRDNNAHPGCFRSPCALLWRNITEVDYCAIDRDGMCSVFLHQEFPFTVAEWHPHRAGGRSDVGAQPGLLAATTLRAHNLWVGGDIAISCRRRILRARSLVQPHGPSDTGTSKQGTRCQQHHSWQCLPGCHRQHQHVGHSSLQWIRLCLLFTFRLHRRGSRGGR